MCSVEISPVYIDQSPTHYPPIPFHLVKLCLSDFYLFLRQGLTT